VPVSAQSLEDLGGDEDREDLEADAARVTAALVAARKRRKKLEQERVAATAQDATRPDMAQA
jgi:hypothetical protein